MKIRSVAAELFYADGQIDTTKICQRVKKWKFDTDKPLQSKNNFQCSSRDSCGIVFGVKNTRRLVCNYRDRTEMSVSTEDCAM